MSKNQLRNLTFNETFESSLIQHNNEKFVIDKSLIKGIKQNDASKIIDSNAVSQGNQNKQVYNELQELSSIVIQARKKYDEVKTSSNKCQQQIQKLKNQKQFLVGEQNKYNQIIETHRRQLDQTTKRLQDITNLMQSTIYRKDIYANIKDSSKHDLLVLKKRYFDKDVRLLRDTTKLRTIRTQHDSKVKLSIRCREVLQSMEKTVIKKQLQRTSKIQSFYEVLSKKQLNEQGRLTRQKQIKEAMISAMTDKLDQQKEWYRMMVSNLFLKGILKAKMERLMNKYNVVQLSFHKMKQATSVKNSNDFIQRFLNREETYGILLESISEKQKLLTSLKQQRQQLQKIYINYLYKGQEIGEEKKKLDPKKDNKNQEHNNTYLVIQKLNNQNLSIARKRQLIYEWGIRFITCYSDKKKEQVTKKYPKNKTKQLFVEVTKVVGKFITDLQNQQGHEQKIQQAFLKNNPKSNKMTDNVYQKNTRIKTLSAYQSETAGDTFQQKDMIYDDVSQADYLQYNRRNVKKNVMQNRVFRIKTKPN